MLTEYRNEPFGDFSGDRHSAMQRAIREVGGSLGQTYPIVIGGEKIMTDNVGSSFNPAKPPQLVGAVAQADAELARRAVEVAH
ncbi:MAG: L-glutamate gamma-semialdehyde dehydrogenase, partial [Roseiflexaceae bacterium]|nr:L-glutamate gamma-semialdehyde dehydrogenase [Roseiflexaceae bacterium]